jgi:ribosomal protein S12 methylthiotransferase
VGYQIGFVSLGCAKNLSDTETMMGILVQNGHTITSDAAQADVIIINTCGFIDKAKEESISTILEMAEYKTTGNCKKLIVTGCMAERYREEVLKEMPEVDAVCGTGDYPAINSILEDTISGQHPVLYGHQDDPISDTLPRIRATAPYTAYLKIADGCDNHCTYCIIPRLRGSFRSRKMESILAEAASLAEEGVKEIILVAQDTSRYGIDLYGKKSIASLLNELAKIKGLEFVRLHYCYPENIDEELIQAIKTNSKVCRYLDMPIQHCSDRILKRMGRASTKKELLSLIEMLRREIPDIALRTSLITGFPGETKEDFDELCDFVRTVQFDKLGVFAYSQEEGTPAALLPDQLSEEVKEERCEKIMEIQESISWKMNQNRIGKIYPVLTEGYDESEFMYFGRSYFDSVEVDGLVYFAALDEVEIGEIVQVKILDAGNFDVTGEMIV